MTKLHEQWLALYTSPPRLVLIIVAGMPIPQEIQPYGGKVRQC